MIAVDTNILVYAHRQDVEWHEPALRALTRLAEGNATWAIPWTCVHEFLATVTHPRIFVPPTPLDTALKAVLGWTAAPGCRLLGEGPGYLELLGQIALESRVGGPVIHDLRIAVLCLHHGVAELWTLDRDFSRFPALRTVNPLVDA